MKTLTLFKAYRVATSIVADDEVILADDNAWIEEGRATVAGRADRYRQFSNKLAKVISRRLETLEEDARTGRLVNAMPPGATLDHEAYHDDAPWYAEDGNGNTKYGKTATDVLQMMALPSDAPSTTAIW